MKVFELTDEQLETIEKWKETLPELPDNYTGMVGGNYSYIFIPTGIGVIQLVKRVDGYELNITDFSSM